jgi:hypothetical protein
MAKADLASEHKHLEQSHGTTLDTLIERVLLPEFEKEKRIYNPAINDPRNPKIDWPFPVTGLIASETNKRLQAGQYFLSR